MASNPTREEYELAAKAIGCTCEVYPWHPSEIERRNGAESGLIAYLHKDGRKLTWNPTTDKAQSFDLMIAICPAMEIYRTVVEVYPALEKALVGTCEVGAEATVKEYGSLESATMWAIFLAAVSRGRAMP